MQRVHKRFAWLLLLGFFCQPIISYLAAPTFAEAQNGQQILVCTLKGLQLVTLDGENHEAVVDTGDCPALTLSLIAATGLNPGQFNPTFIPQPPRQQGAREEIPPTLQQHYPPYSSRAPPIS